MVTGDSGQMGLQELPAGAAAEIGQEQEKIRPAFYRLEDVLVEQGTSFKVLGLSALDVSGFL